jgi:hypothetical protein
VIVLAIPFQMFQPTRPPNAIVMPDLKPLFIRIQVSKKWTGRGAFCRVITRENAGLLAGGKIAPAARSKPVHFAAISRPPAKNGLP